MTPVTFSSSFGWFHAAGGSCGIVLCSAQGIEDLCTHKGLRLAAEAFAAEGYPTLRFDYAGTGNSMGDDLEPERVETWVSSIVDAVAWLRATAQADRVVLVGLRLGSALAALAAKRLGSIDGLILLAPTVTGRAYMRELMTLSNFIRKPSGSNQASKAAHLSIAGYIYTAETIADISAIDLLSFDQAPAPKALVVATGSQAGADRLTKAWSALGCDVDRQIFSHYAEFVMDPAFSRFPAEVLQQALGWLDAHFDPGQACDARSKPPAYTPHENGYFRESPVFFDRSQTLFGMMCQPKALAHDRPIVLFLNAGANRHIGWGRSTVEMCRRLAETGFASLRIDIAAIGDSPDKYADQDRILYRDESVADVSEALDWLQAQGFHNVTLVGLCAGAHLGFHTAVADPRVTRVVMVNLQKFLWHAGDSLAIAYRESYQSTGFYLNRLLMLKTWTKFLRGEVKAKGILQALTKRTCKKLAVSYASFAGCFGRRIHTETALVHQWMKELDKRKVEQWYVYSEGDAGLDELALYRRLRGTRVKGAPAVSVAFIENADHNLSEHAARDRLVEILEGLLRKPKSQPVESAASSIQHAFSIPARHH